MKIGMIRNEVLAAPMTPQYVWGEVKELLVEVAHLDKKGMREEWGDVVVCGLCCAARAVPALDEVQLRGAGRESAMKFMARFTIWSSIFTTCGVVFRKEYLAGGGNYRKQHKVGAALAMAGVDHPDFDSLTEIVGGWVEA